MGWVADLGAGVSKAKWLFSKPNRARLIFRARVEVIACVVARQPTLSILLGQSHYHSMWMPPQEGVHLKESLEDALKRCLTVECGVSKTTFDPQKRLIHLKSITYFDKLLLPSERQGERLVADDASGTILESWKLKCKAYWVAIVIVDSTSSLKTKPDGHELKDLKWYSFEEAVQIISSTNHEAKARMLERVLSKVKLDVVGGVKSKGQL